MMTLDEEIGCRLSVIVWSVNYGVERVTSFVRGCSVAKLRIRSELKVRQKGTRSFLVWYAFVAL